MFDEIIEKMSAYMKRHKMNQSDFAQAMGISPAAVSYWLSGSRYPNTQNYITFQKLL